MNDRKIRQSVKHEHRGTITACAYRCPTVYDFVVYRRHATDELHRPTSNLWVSLCVVAESQWHELYVLSRHRSSVPLLIYLLMHRYVTTYTPCPKWNEPKRHASTRV